MKVALIEPPIILDWEKGNKERISCLVNKNVEINRFDLVGNVEEADLIVLLESCTFKTQKDIKYFESLQHFNKSSKRLCTLNYEDAPPGFLPGLYSSLERFKYDPAIHLSWPHLVLPNEKINGSLPVPEHSVRMLFTFSGSCSHPIRRRLFESYKSSSTLYKVCEVKKWYDHNEGEKQSYIDDIRESKFVLCPRGIASYSHRIIETLALGKVPVIIADDWVPFSIPERDYFVKVAEKDISNIIPILEQKEDEYEKLKDQATSIYSKYFDPRLCYSVALNQLTDFYDRLLAISPDYFRHRWRSRKFWKTNKWCIEDRIIRKLKKLLKRPRS